jgi:hypothetical protein
MGRPNVTVGGPVWSIYGIGISFGKPADGALRDQITSEWFYRFQLTQFLAVTPDIQLIANPALDPSEDLLALFGIRLRAAFSAIPYAVPLLQFRDNVLCRKTVVTPVRLL